MWVNSLKFDNNLPIKERAIKCIFHGLLSSKFFTKITTILGYITTSKQLQLFLLQKYYVCRYFSEAARQDTEPLRSRIELHRFWSGMRLL